MSAQKNVYVPWVFPMPCINPLMSSRRHVTVCVCDYHISLGYSPKIVIAIVKNVETKLFHDRYVDDVSNSCMKPGVNVLTKDGISRLALKVSNGYSSIAIVIQICVAFAHIRQETFVSDLYEGGTTV